MNIALEQTEEHVNGIVTNRYGDAFIRGNNGWSFLIRHDRSLSYSSSTQYYTYQLQSQFSFDKAITRPSYVRQHFKNSVSLCYFADMVSSNGTSAAAKNYICNLSCQWP